MEGLTSAKMSFIAGEVCVCFSFFSYSMNIVKLNIKKFFLGALSCVTLACFPQGY